MTNYTLTFIISLVINITITLFSSEWFISLVKKVLGRTANIAENDGEKLLNSSQEKDERVEASIHSKLLFRYLSVYLLAAMSDWLQGPYVYALYDAYGYSRHEIAVLFVAGFGSSMVFGSFIGSMADSGGRKKYTILYCIIYIASCLTKHVKSFSVLLFGRVLGGIATSLLFSVFDSWLIRSHSVANLDKKYVAKSFSSAFFGNCIVAIFAGLLANGAAEHNEMLSIASNTPSLNKFYYVYFGGYLNPFDISILALLLCGISAMVLWEENYGERDSNSTTVESSSVIEEKEEERSRSTTTFICFRELKRAYISTMRSREILFCGLVSSIFESSMYIFVFMWTPALTQLTSAETGSETVELPFGLIFSTFMVCSMTGSSIFSILISYNYRPETITIFVLLISLFCFTIFFFSNSSALTYVTMNVFEICVGVYFPVMGTMKSIIVPEAQRSAIYNLFRIPLNFMVVLSLVTHLSITESFSICMLMLASGTFLQIELRKRRLLSDPSCVQVQVAANEEEKRMMVTDNLPTEPIVESV